MADYPVLEVENFGPVKRARIELRPLTVLLGKNNTGKSFLASLIYVLGRYAPPITYILEPSEHYSLEEVAERIRADIVDSGKRAISYLTERPESLIRWGAEKAKIKISWHSLRLSIAINSRGNIRVEADIPEKLIKRADKIKIEKEELSHVRFITTLIGPEHPLITRMARWRFALWEPKIMPYRPVYLLAERAGLLRIYRPLLIVYLRTSVPELLPRRLASLMEQVESGMKLPRLAADFISDVLLTEPVHDKTFSDIFELLERLMEGHVELTEELEIIYKTRGYAISLDKSSSLILSLIHISEPTRPY